MGPGQHFLMGPDPVFLCTLNGLLVFQLECNQLRARPGKKCECRKVRVNQRDSPCSKSKQISAEKKGDRTRSGRREEGEKRDGPNTAGGGRECIGRGINAKKCGRSEYRRCKGGHPFSKRECVPQVHSWFCSRLQDIIHNIINNTEHSLFMLSSRFYCKSRVMKRRNKQGYIACDSFRRIMKAKCSQINA